jgi:hexosaminidase
MARGRLSSFEPSIGSIGSNHTNIHTLEITQKRQDDVSTFKPLAGQVDESYNLTIEANGTAKISAVSSTGILHALETFIQLFYQHSSGKAIYTNLAPGRCLSLNPISILLKPGTNLCWQSGRCLQYIFNVPGVLSEHS